MCRKKGEGGRCYNHIRKEWLQAKEALEADPDNPALQEDFTTVEHELNLTRTRRIELSREYETLIASTDPDDLAKAVEVGQQLADLTNEADARKGINPFTRNYNKDTEAQLEAFRSELTNGWANLADDLEYRAFLNAMANFPTYSHHNTLLIHLQRPDATMVAGFRKWQDEGRTVRKGEKAIRIFAPNRWTAVKKDENGKPVIGEDGKPVKVVKRGKYPFTVVSVFSAEQTEGKPLPSFAHPKGEPPPGLTNNLTQLVEAEGYTIRYEKGLGTRGGYTNPKDRTVVINAENPPGKQTTTLAHELGHIKAGHAARLAEYKDHDCRGEMEVEAESIAYVVLRSQGFGTEISRGAMAYVRGWSGGDPKKVESTMKAVSTTVKEIVSALNGLTNK